MLRTRRHGFVQLLIVNYRLLDTGSAQFTGFVYVFPCPVASLTDHWELAVKVEKSRDTVSFTCLSRHEVNPGRKGGVSKRDILFVAWNDFFSGHPKCNS